VRVSVWVCVCVRERERERERDWITATSSLQAFGAFAPAAFVSSRLRRRSHLVCRNAQPWDSGRATYRAIELSFVPDCSVGFLFF
jgi:hypothetical protein